MRDTNFFEGEPIQMEQLVYRIWTYVALLRYRPIY